ncbi:O-glucosyltransferase rumi-like protein [Actinidia rufa]|uniref:O-glucosyltransferase rumi-like protein n=1 Tax=Actinidia rufa TaxID=165716 RepID=A0A7J0EV45_9ERIC|nr:O-glucosyltransferase rumi-like protein [Actinidia rufa]
MHENEGSCYVKLDGEAYANEWGFHTSHSLLHHPLDYRLHIRSSDRCCTSFQKTFLPSTSSATPPARPFCSFTCPAYHLVKRKADDSSAETCPEYFRWIHEDVRPWKATGITKEMVVEGAENKAHVRIVAVNGRVPELQIKPWEMLRKELEGGNNRVKWEERKPKAYWKGNTRVCALRKELLKCNVSEEQDWGALLYDLDWQHERGQKFNNTSLASQCTHRYKIYVEGAAWSVSEKYILACDSASLIVTPHYYDFFTRSLLPTIHYWPINEKTMCKSIKFAVDWGNNHPEEAQEIGKAGSKFIQEELKMKNVYDYMFHLLYEYGKLLKYQPTVPEGSIEVCSETLACSGRGLKKKFKFNSMVMHLSDSGPCIMPPPYDSSSLQLFLERKLNLTKQVESWEAGERK